MIVVRGVRQHHKCVRKEALVMDGLAIRLSLTVVMAFLDVLVR